MWHSTRRISPVFASEPTLSWEYLPYHMNIKEEEALLQFNSGKCPRELMNIVYADQILIQKVPTLFEFMMTTRRKHYKILDNQGSKLFYVEQMTDLCTHLCCDKYPINYNVLSEPERKVVLSFTGWPGILGGGGEITPNLILSNSTSIPLGEVVQESNMCNPIFCIVDSKGQKGFSIQGPEEGNCWGIAQRAEFNICQHIERSDVIVIGKLHRNLKLKSLKSWSESNSLLDCKFKWVIEFPRDLDPSTKILVLSAAFLLESQYYG